MVAEIKRWSSGWWMACILAGLIGGVAMAVYEGVSQMITGHSGWYLANVVAAINPRWRPPVDHFVTDPSLAGLFMHLCVSAFWGALYGFLVMTLTPSRGRNWREACMLGLGWGVVFWLAMGLIIGPVVDPYLYTLNQVNYFVAHLVYGVITALCVLGMTGKRAPTIMFAPTAPVETEIPGRTRH